MESQPRNTEFRTNPENFHPCTLPRGCICADISKPLLGTYAIGTRITWPPPSPLIYLHRKWRNPQLDSLETLPSLI